MRRLTLCLLLAGSFLAHADSSVDPDTGLVTWQAETGGIQVRLTQIKPDQARAFYTARGFAAETAELYAAKCVFMTVVRNVGNTTLQHRLADWRYTHAATTRPIRSKSHWDALWKKRKVNETARIAFNWAQFPATQTFAPGDWNQGMTSYRVPRGERFDLRFVWRSDGKIFSGTLHEVQCAADAS